MSKKKHLLYLSFALPPELRALHPEINPAGNALESQMLEAFKPHCEIRSTGLLPVPVPRNAPKSPSGPGVLHDLILLEKPPEIWTRTVALHCLKKNYLKWRAEGWRPDAVMVYNLSPVYNAFITWLAKQPDRPKLVLLLLDSANLGKKLPPLKQFRYRFKPFHRQDEAMLKYFDGCIGLSTVVEKYFTPRGIPFLWMPGACNPARSPKPEAAPADGPLRFCYFGALGPHAGALEMTNTFLGAPGECELHIAGYGKQSKTFEEIARTSPRLKYHGLIPPDECLRLGQSCDVLVNPRVPGYGNENNMASKLFDYALCRRSIITSRISGTDKVLGPEAFYFEPEQHAEGLRNVMQQVSSLPRKELLRRGAAIGNRIATEYNWPRQAERMALWLREKIISDA